jgi:transposase
MSKYSVKLSREQRTMLEGIVKKGESTARKIVRANILLKTDIGEYGARWSTTHIREAFDVGLTLITKVRKLFVEKGLEDALYRKPQPRRPSKLKINGRQEALIIAVLCTERPEGQERWTLRALTDRIIELEIVEGVSYETVRTVLTKNELKPWQKKQWCVGPTKDSEYVHHLEDILEVYIQAYNKKRPQVCLDEGSVQCLKDKIPALAMKPGQVKKEDYQYTHDGYCNIFMACEPLTGKRFTEVTKRRTKVDFAHFLRQLVDNEYPDAEKIVVVMDNLNTHRPASLYEAFSPAEAMRIWKKLEIHYTPKHGSWLNMAEIELSVLGRQVLHERLESMEIVKQRVAAWQAKRNAQQAKIHWRFTTDDARIKLERLYPTIKEYNPDNNTLIEA